jgi:hypothetical protein
MAKLKLIDSDLLLDIIRASRPGPPSDQNLVLSSDANSNVDTLLKQPPTIENSAKINSELNNRAVFLDKFYDKYSEPPTMPQPAEQPPEDSVLKYFGPQEKKRVEPILNRMRSKTSAIGWDKDFRLTHNGIAIPNSNIHDLIKAVTGKSKKIKPTPGLSTFINQLTRLNVPLYTAGTDRIRRFLQTGKIHSDLDPPRKRKRIEEGSGIFANWK